jgi:hypothetical protein
VMAAAADVFVRFFEILQPPTEISALLAVG